MLCLCRSWSRWTLRRIWNGFVLPPKYRLSTETISKQNTVVNDSCRIFFFGILLTRIPFNYPKVLGVKKQILRKYECCPKRKTKIRRREIKLKQIHTQFDHTEFPSKAPLDVSNSKLTDFKINIFVQMFFFEIFSCFSAFQTIVYEFFEIIWNLESGIRNPETF